MKLEQASVRHVRYGSGTVLRCENGTVTVSFPEAGEKQFVYPDVFQKFLRIEDPELAAAVAGEIIFKKAEEDARRREQEEQQKALAAAREAAKAPRAKSKPKKA